MLKPESEQMVDKQNQVWKIDYMYADIGPSLRMTLYQNDINEKKEKKESEQIQQNQILTQLIKKRISYQIRNLDQSGVQEMSDTELEETRKLRMNQMYQRAGLGRFALFSAIFLGGIGYYLFFYVNKKKSIANSSIHRNAMMIIKNSIKVRMHLGEQNKLVFNKQIRGHQIKDKA